MKIRQFAILAATALFALSFTGCESDGENNNPDAVEDTDGGDTDGGPLECTVDDVETCAQAPRECDASQYEGMTEDDYTWPDDGIVPLSVDTNVEKGVAVTCDHKILPDCDGIQELQELVAEQPTLDGQTICFADATYFFDDGVTLTGFADGVTLRGVGDGFSVEEGTGEKLTTMDEPQRTILDFSNAVDFVSNGDQTECVRAGVPKSIAINGASDVTIRDLHVRDSPGDAIESTDATNIAFLGVAATWTAEHCVDNGAYGLYPVKTTGALVQDSYVRGSADAGIYVGQSDQVLVTNSHTYNNVAGIEIENTTNSEVKGNYAYDNTGGMLIFNLPGIEKQGYSTKLHENHFWDNNTENFGDPGTTVGQVPPGVGVMVLSNDRNDIHDNVIENNNTAGVLVLSYLDELAAGSTLPDYFNRFSENNCIRDNEFADNGAGFGGSYPGTSGLIIPKWENFVADEAGIEEGTPAPDIIVDGCSRLAGGENWDPDDGYLYDDPEDAFVYNQIFENTDSDSEPVFFDLDYCTDASTRASSIDMNDDQAPGETCDKGLPPQTGRVE